MEGLQPNQKVRVPVAEFAARFSNKKEVWDFLNYNVKAYCATRETVTIWHLRDMANGKKGYIKQENVKHLTVPHYESLSLERILEWTRQYYPHVLERMFPEGKELYKLPRQVSRLFQVRSVCEAKRLCTTQTLLS